MTAIEMQRRSAKARWSGKTAEARRREMSALAKVRWANPGSDRNNTDKMKTHTITEKWLAGTTFLVEVDGWQPGDRGQQYHSVPGFRCNCGNIYRVGQKVAVTHGTQSGKAHFWATCGNCGNFMF